MAAFAVAASVGDLFSLNFALGGAGAKGGSADTVTVNEKGYITTVGNLANGIFAQSVGGGGGSGGGAVAAGISGGITLGLAMGGSGGEAGNGSTVTVNAMGGIDTTGDMSHGILAQSVGGGGGNGGYSVAGGAGSLAASVGLGGNGGAGGDGDTVTVDVTGIEPTDIIHTGGDASHGIFAQSVGGGGGSGGFAVAAGIGGGSISVSLGGTGSGGGTGGTVDVTNDDTLITEGNGSYGLLAQSVGGGGGDGGFSFAGAAGVMAASVAVGGNGGAGGNGGGVTVDNFGDVITLGDLSFWCPGAVDRRRRWQWRRLGCRNVGDLCPERTGARCFGRHRRRGRHREPRRACHPEQ